MTSEAQRWERVKQVVAEIERLSGSARMVRLQQVCAGDDELLHEAISLLAYEARIDVFEPGAISNDPFAQPVIVGRYRILRLLGSGGMGTVYLAERADDEYHQQVAVKVMHSSDPRLVARFRVERQILAQLEHANIARLLDGGTMADGRPYFAMEFVEGQRIDEYVKEQRLSIPKIVGPVLNQEVFPLKIEG